LNALFTRGKCRLVSRTVLIIPDKFKGTLTAQQAARAIARGWHRAHPGDRLELSPMSDGGDGFGAILSAALEASPRTSRSVDAAGRPCRVSWWCQTQQRTAIIESARVIGLAMLPAGKYHPFQLDTTGLGHLLNAVARRQCSTCLIGIGGSATNDGGFGLARAMGWRFLDPNGLPIERWPDLVRLRTLLAPSDIPNLEIVVATDVRNPLLGPHGASRIYGPQKGLRPQDQPVAEAALRRLARIAHEHLGIDHSIRPGAGAAGGLGFGLMAFLNARPEAGFDLFARYTRLEDQLDQADLVITGEGAVDNSSLMGKGVGEIARHCQRRKLPCVALGGVTRDLPRLRRRFTHVAALTDLTTSAEALSQPARWLTRLTQQIANSMRYG
jgi:glycerate 2-kinase